MDYKSQKQALGRSGWEEENKTRVVRILGIIHYWERIFIERKDQR